MASAYRAVLMGNSAPHFDRSRLLLAFAAIHAAMFAYDLHHPDRFLRADRADERLQSVQSFIDALHGGGDLCAFFASHGVPGDWLPQSLLYLAGGQLFVIAAQIALVLASISCVWRIGRAIGLGERGALAAAALYGALPHTLVFPHQLAAEAIFVPLVILVALFPVLSPFILLGLGIWWFVRRRKRKAAAAAPVARVEPVVGDAPTAPPAP